MRKIFILILIQMSFLGALIAQTGTSWYSQDFTGLIGVALDNYVDGKAIWDTTTATTTSKHWEIYNTTKYGDNGTANTNVFRILNDTHIDSMQNEVINVRINLPREPDVSGVPSNYYLDFDWWSDQGNLGGGTDPELDPDAAITIEAKFHNGTSWGTTWTEIWSEDDQARLEETTINAPYGAFNWDDYASYIEGWYTSELDLTDIAGNQPDSIMLRITYEGINAGEFYFDNLDIRYETVPDYEVDIKLSEDYYYMPWLFAKNMNMNFIATVTQNTDTTIKVGDDRRVNLYLEGSLAGFDAMTQADFSSGNVHEYTFPNFVGEFPVENDTYYSFKATETVTSEPSEYEHLRLDDSNYRRDNNTAIATYLNAELATPGIGVLYEIPNEEHFNGVNIQFNTSGVSFSYDLIKVSGPSATSGELIYSSGNLSTSTNFSDDPDDIILETGFYLIMVNQLTSTNVDLKQDNQNDGFYYRGTAGSLTKIENEGWPMVGMKIQPNRAPGFVSGTVYNHKINQNQKFSYILSVEDDDEDLAGFTRIDPAQTWLQASWLSIVDNGDNTFTLNGIPTSTGNFEFDMQIGDAEGDSITQTFTFEVLAPIPLDFVEDFNVSSTPYSNNEAWVTIPDAAHYGSSITWDYTYEYDYYAGAKFKSDNYVAKMLGENNVAQEEWLISPGITIPALSTNSDSTVSLEFAYRMNWKYFVGPEVGNNNNGYNAGDISVLISNDGGDTWSDPIWNEDDADIMLATTISNDYDTSDDDDDTYISPEDWPAYADGSYNLSENDYFLSRIDISEYAGQDIWIAFKYESDSSNVAANADFRLDFVDVKLIEPAVELVTIAQNTTGYTMIPYFQAQDVSMMAKVTNLDRHDIEGGILEAVVVDGSSETVYSENTTFDVDGEDTTSVTLGTDFTPVVNAGNVDNTHTFTFTSKYNNVDYGYPSDIDSYTITYTNNEYAIDNNSYNHPLDCELGAFVGMKFDVFKEDNLRLFKLYISNFSSGEALSFTLVKDGVVVYNSPSYIAGYDFGFGWGTFDIEDFKIQPGTYYLMVKTEVYSGSLELGVDSDSDGSYYRGLPSNIAVDTEDTGNLMLRMSLGNDAPSFLPAIANQEATVGTEFLYNVSAKDDNSDSLTFIVEQQPLWITLENKNDGNRAVFSGTPGAGDIGSNLVQIAVYDDRDTIREVFTIDVEQSPAPIFITTPVVIANEGIEYTYTAIGSDPLGDDVTVSVGKLPSWLKGVVSTDGDTIVLTGKPLAANVDEHQVKLNVTDQFGMTAQQAFEINVKANIAPEFITFGAVEANEDLVYTYDIVALDDNENDILAITSSTTPGWLTLTDNGDGTAVLTGSPAQADVGANEVVLTVTDNLGLSDSQTYTIMVYDVNDSPVFTSTQADVSLQAGLLFSYSISVSDADNDDIMFNTDMPDWLLLTNQGNGKALLRGMPMLDALGNNTITITATDGNVDIVQAFVINVIDTTSAPEVPMVNNAQTPAKSSFEFVLNATDSDGDNINFTVENMPEWLTLTNKQESVVFTGTPIDMGAYSLAINVTDGLHTVVSILNIEVSESETTLVIENILQNIEVFPNPANEYVTIKNAQGCRVVVYNIIGEKILEIADVKTNENQIDVSGLNKGTYIINIHQGEKMVIRKINIIR